MRLIDADTLIQEIKRWKEREIADGLIGKGIKAGYDAAMICVSEMPTIEERKHGHWVDSYECSVCGAWMATDCIGDCLPEEAQHYCYNCGAAMDEENNNE